MASYNKRPEMALKEGTSYGATIEMEDGGKIELELWPEPRARARELVRLSRP